MSPIFYKPIIFPKQGGRGGKKDGDSGPLFPSPLQAREGPFKSPVRISREGPPTILFFVKGTALTLLGHVPFKGEKGAGKAKEKEGIKSIGNRKKKNAQNKKLRCFNPEERRLNTELFMKRRRARIMNIPASMKKKKISGCVTRFPGS